MHRSDHRGRVGGVAVRVGEIRGSIGEIDGLQEIALADQTLTATSPPFATALLVAGYSMCQRSSIAWKIASGGFPSPAIEITRSRAWRYGDEG